MSDNKKAPIGVFDSGVGGLTVVLEMLRQMPGEPFIYYADTAHVPYGNRDPEELKGFAAGITKFLYEQGCKMIIMACNTSTSLIYEELKAKYDVPIIGVIEPGVDKALEITGNSCIGVIATTATINSGVHKKMLKNMNPQVDIVPVSCPKFVPFVEKGQVEGNEVYEAAFSYLKPMKDKGIDTIILGCTHYPFLLPVITDVLGPFVTVIDPARETVRRAGEKLKKLDLLNQEGNPTQLYCVSGEPAEFRKMAGIFLQRDIGPIKGVKL